MSVGEGDGSAVFEDGQRGREVGAADCGFGGFGGGGGYLFYERVSGEFVVV